MATCVSGLRCETPCHRTERAKREEVDAAGNDSPPIMDHAINNLCPMPADRCEPFGKYFGTETAAQIPTLAGQCKLRNQPGLVVACFLPSPFCAET